MSGKTSDNECVGQPAELQAQPRFMEHYNRGDRKSVKVGTVESCGELLSGMKVPMQVWMPVKDLTYIQAAGGSTWRRKAFQGLTLS